MDYKTYDTKITDHNSVPHCRIHKIADSQFAHFTDSPIARLVHNKINPTDTILRTN